MENTIDTLGTVPSIKINIPDNYMGLAPKRKYHVGLNRYMGRLRYAYYQRRGWIKGQYYVRPQQSAAVEWLHCLVSPSYARATWLRLTPEAEEQALLTLKRVVIGLFVAVAFTAGMIVGQQRMLHHIQNQQRQTQLQVLSA